MTGIDYSALAPTDDPGGRRNAHHAAGAVHGPRTQEPSGPDCRCSPPLLAAYACQAPVERPPARRCSTACSSSTASAIFFQWLFLVITGVSALISMRFNERESMNRGEYYALLLFACSGMSLMAASGDLILTFLGIEILSIATYILAGFKRSDVRVERIVAEVLPARIVRNRVPALWHRPDLRQHRDAPITTRSASSRSLQGTPQTTAVIGMGLLLVGFGFKVALVPFHAWAPDVYEGAPTPVTAFMTVGPKAAGFAALIRVLVQALPALGVTTGCAMLWVSAILTMTLGNVVAILQTNVKRMLAYSAIAHAGLHPDRHRGQQQHGIRRGALLPRRLHGDEPGGLQHRAVTQPQGRSARESGGLCRAWDAGRHLPLRRSLSSWSRWPAFR